MKRIFSLLLSISLIPFFGIGAAQAQPTNYLIKGPGDTVYFNSSEGKRYVFPTEAVFKSWYPDFSSVAQISGSELAALPLAGNVTMRPGYSMVKITTDPKVYAVSRYGILHWVKTEQVAKDIYGDNWNKQIKDVADTYFIDYVISYPIETATQYDKTLEMSVADPGANIRPATLPVVTTPPATSPTTNPAQVSMTLSANEAVMNQTVVVFATVTDSSLPIKKIEIRSASNASPLATCLDAVSCQLMYFVQSAPLNETFTAVAYDSANTKFEVPASAKPVLMVASASNQIQMSVAPQSVTAGSRTSFSSIYTGTNIVSDHDIYILIPGETVPVLIKDCGPTSQCASSNPFYRTTNFYSKIVTGGQSYFSPTVALNVTGDAPKPIIRTTSKINGATTLEITAPYGETIGQTLIKEGTEIDDPTVAMCQSSLCTVTIQATTPASYTAFISVGGKYEKSNSVTVTP